MDGMREPYTNVLKLVHVDIVKSRITDMSPVIFDILQLFASNENLCNVFMDYCQPSNVDIGRNYADNILGALLSLSILPKTNNGSYEYFQNPLDSVNYINFLLTQVKVSLLDEHPIDREFIVFKCG